MPRFGSLSLPISLVLLAALSLAWGPIAAAGFADPPADAEASEVAGAVAIIERARGVYQHLNTFQATVRHRSARETATGELIDFKWGNQVRYARPDRLIIESDTSRLVVSDGRMLLVSPQRGVYSQREAPAPLSLESIAGELSVLDFTGSPVGPLLLQGDLPYLMKSVASVERAEPEVREGRPGMRIYGRGDLERYHDVGTFPVSMWFDDETGMLVELRAEFTEHYQLLLGGPDDPAPPAGQSDERQRWVVSTTTIEDIIINEPIPDELWNMEAPAELREVDDLTVVWRRTHPPHELIGQRVPVNELVTLDGKQLRLEDLRGRIIVLDFWALWCGPCLASMPHVQALHETYSTRPVTLIGINRDAAGSEERIRGYLDRRGFTIEQVHDPAGIIADQFVVRGIPHMVFIDQEGMIREVKVGFGEGDEVRLRVVLDALLAGEEVPTVVPEAVREPAMPLAEERAQSLTRGGTVANGSIIFGQILHADVNGDGEDEIILPRFDGQLTILKNTGERIGRISLDTDGRTQFLRSIHALRIAGELHWVAQFGHYPYQPLEQRWIGLFNAEGGRIWKHDPALGDDRNCAMHIATGDLNGDGAEEIVISLATHTRRTVGPSEVLDDQAAYLIVLNVSGDVLVRRHLGERTAGAVILLARDGSPAAVLADADGSVVRFDFDAGSLEAPPTGTPPRTR